MEHQQEEQAPRERGQLLQQAIISGNAYCDEGGSTDLERRRKTALLYRATLEIKLRMVIDDRRDHETKEMA